MIGSLGEMFAHPFMQHALLAGTAIALLSGLVGYFVVLRGQVFAGDMLSHVAYAGALAALAVGVDLRLGLFTATVAVGVGIGLLGGRAGADDVIIGNTMAWVLGLGVFFLALYTTYRSTGNSSVNAAVLFGSIFGISASSAWTAVLVALGLIGVLLVIARPLLFAMALDPVVAAARGVPVRLLGPRCFWPWWARRRGRPARRWARCCLPGCWPRLPPPRNGSPIGPGRRCGCPLRWPWRRCGSGWCWPTWCPRCHPASPSWR